MKKKVGRPTKLTPEVRKKIEEAAAWDASVEEICFYADISRFTYYQWIKENPELSNRIEELRNRPVLKARQTAVTKLSETYSNAMDYLSRKRKVEFSPRQEIVGGTDGQPIQINLTNDGLFLHSLQSAPEPEASAASAQEIQGDSLREAVGQDNAGDKPADTGSNSQ